MIKRPDEIRLGVPDEHDDKAELHAKSFKVWRDEDDPQSKVDLAITLQRSDIPMLRSRLGRLLDQHASPHDLIQIVFDTEPSPQGGMPPDPMGPALVAATYYATGINGAAGVNTALRQGTAAADTATVSDFLKLAMNFYRNITSAIHGTTLYQLDGSVLAVGYEGPAPLPPPIPIPVTTLGDVPVQDLTNALLVSSTLAIARIHAATPTIVGDGFVAVQQLYDDVRVAFTGRTAPP